MPPTLKRELCFLRIGVLRAENLKIMDKNVITGAQSGSGIDAFVRIQYAEGKGQTHIVKDLSPTWNSVFWIPVLVPPGAVGPVGSVATIEILDSDKTSVSEVGKIYVRFDNVHKRELPKLGWYHLYGLGPEAEELQKQAYFSAAASGSRGSRRLLRHHAEYFESEWRGKVLLHLDIEKRQPPSPNGTKQVDKWVVTNENVLVRKQHGATPSRELAPVPAEFELFCCCLGGSNLNNAVEEAGTVSRTLRSVAMGDGQEVLVEMVYEDHEWRRGPRKLFAGGCAIFAHASTDRERNSCEHSGQLYKVNNVRQLMLPLEAEADGELLKPLRADRRQLATIFIYLVEMLPGSKRGRRLAFLPIEPKDVFSGKYKEHT
eukprot:1671394-Prymnesium_polylepis.2